MFGSRLFKRNKPNIVKLVVLIVCCFLILMLMNKNNTIPDEKSADLKDVASLRMKKDEKSIAREEQQVLTGANIGTEIRSHADTPAHESQDRLGAGDKSLTGSYKASNHVNLEKLKTTVKQLNQEQKVLNKEKFPLRNRDSVVIVIQVHTRAKYLIKLIESLRNARGISDALLIFSHDYYASDINSLVRSIDFCQVLQIFFPHSEQLYPDKFPGTDPEDCPRDMPKRKAVAIGCKNADHPDMYSHYREAKFTMTKHHWWWKAKRVFQGLNSTSDHKGLVLFLEEDHYVSPDFYEVAQKAYALSKTSTECKEYGCDIITLGDYKKISSFEDVRSDLAQVKPWKSTENNMGMAFDQGTWNKLNKCHKLFCTYDDYNWDWTLMKMSLVCFQKPLTVLLVKAPRVFHLGMCGLHHKTGDCNVEEAFSGVQGIIERSKKGLYPKKLAINVAQPWVQGNVGQPNGGWGDIRDHELCMEYAKSTEK